MEVSMSATMNATVLHVHNCVLCVCDHDTNQEVIVHTPHACCFCACDQVCICYNGVMTRSIPPQITATCITKIPPCGCR